MAAELTTNDRIASPISPAPSITSNTTGVQHAFRSAAVDQTALINVAVLNGRPLVVELIHEGLNAQGIRVQRCGRNEELALALRTAANGGVIIIDGIVNADMPDRLNLVSRCRELGGEVLVVMVEDNSVSAGEWVEAGASGVLLNTAGLQELFETVVRLARHEIVLGVAVREGILARLRAHRQATSERQAAFYQLTRREAQVLRELATGANPEEVARISFVSLNTVRSQIRSVLAKLGVNSVVAAVALAYRSGWLETDQANQSRIR
jgi:two-component system, NarL family, nitrate/nitrite response regulator NarL